MENTSKAEEITEEMKAIQPMTQTEANKPLTDEEKKRYGKGGRITE